MYILQRIDYFIVPPASLAAMKLKDAKMMFILKYHLALVPQIKE